MSIGTNIKNLRVSANISQAELAKRIGIGQSMLCQIERGKKSVTVANAKKIAITLKCSLEEILNEEETECKTA